MDNTVDVTPQLAEQSEMTPVNFVVDNIVVQVTVARVEGGVKVGEESFTARLLYPFGAIRGDNVDALRAQVEQQARAQWEAQQQNGA